MGPGESRGLEPAPAHRLPILAFAPLGTLFGAAAVLQVVDSIRIPSASTLLLLLIAVPAWVVALLTVRLWLRKRRRETEAAPLSPEAGSGSLP